jgi:hypothetical protein
MLPFKRLKRVSCKRRLLRNRPLPPCNHHAAANVDREDNHAPGSVSSAKLYA